MARRPGAWAGAFAFRSAALGELHDSSPVAQDSNALRRRLADDGYLLLRSLLHRDAVDLRDVVEGPQ